MTLDGLHERLRTDKIDIHIRTVRHPLSQLLLIQIAISLRLGVLLTTLFIAIKTLQLRMRLHQRIDFVAEGMHTAMPRRMNESDWPAAWQCRIEHGQQRCDANPAADEHQWFIARRQAELP